MMLTDPLLFPNQIHCQGDKENRPGKFRVLSKKLRNLVLNYFASLIVQKFDRLKNTLGKTGPKLRF
ncbi:tyrosine-protein kinase RYK [Aphanothece sacrum FPU1]|uniref:Tyrosine-protein kinase RYK n=1 Tax=Aphanothece sacrum FPU1 TaxID=1920663 RepID=A0A401IN38_APHSA|nr:tyrosine-protein kinase RYK [Aphanothece sacrum FPU1]GBF86171.1 tyrosine-protein kinase [Aphanothece sacrum FPU3]